MATTTTLQGIRVPETTDDPNIVDDLTKAVNDLELKLVGTYASVADRASRITSPIEGQVALMKDTNKIVWYDGSSWLQIYPPEVPSITSGSAVPSNATGANGDVFFKI